MKKDKKNEELENCDDKLSDENNSTDLKDSASSNELNNEEVKDKDIKEVMAKLEIKEKQCGEYLGMLQRTAAEFDNYKKRTAKEKEALYSDAVSDVVSALLPVVDSFERALSASCNGEEGSSPLKDGIELVYKQLKDVMKNLGIEEIKCVGEGFDPQLHNAVMHIEDSSYDENVIVEEFQKGYILKDRVIRHSMVKVAN